MPNKTVADKMSRIFTWLVITFYGTVMLYFCYRTDAWVPDESWFFDYAETLHWNSFSELLRTPNYLGYGSLYWVIYASLNTMLKMRLLSWACMMVIPLLIVLVLRKVVAARWFSVLLSIILFVSCPMAWFTGKIIGPELLGNALGAIGVTLIMLKYCPHKPYIKYLLGGCVLGISMGIKLYNAVFIAFIIIYDFYPDFIDCKSFDFKRIFVRGGGSTLIGCAVGFLITNPLFLLDSQTYLSNISVAKSNPTVHWIWELLTLHRIEWDLVNSGGFCNCIVSLIGLILIFALGCIFAERRRMTVSTVAAFLAIMILFSTQTRVLGWYFIPFLFFVPLCISEKTIYTGVIIVNFGFICSDTFYQIESKIEQLNNVENIEDISEIVYDKYEEFEGYTPFYFIDVCIGDLSSAFGFEKYDYENENCFIVISNRYRSNEWVNQIYKKASDKADGFYILYSEGDINIIIHQVQ